LVIDIGTTTTDIVPLVDGRPVPAGRTDRERLDQGELVYGGWRRTPLCAFLGTSQAAELFATTVDVYLELGVVDDDPNDCDTADGRPRTRAAAGRRLARMMCGDLETTTPRQRRELAEEVNFKLLGQIALAADRVIQRLPASPRQVIACGSGECLVRGVLSSRLFKVPMANCPIFSFDRESGPGSSAVACALAVAILLRDSLPA
jgi:probable H4MPT-linked C1 transfer pathway protein